MNREECSERIRLVDEYSRLITEFNNLLESLNNPAHERKERVWRAAAGARADSQIAWESLEKHIAEHKCIDRNDHEQQLNPVHRHFPSGHRKASRRPHTITPAHASNTRAVTHLAAAGASSPALTYQTRSDSEKYRTAIAPIGIRAILGANR